MSNIFAQLLQEGERQQKREHTDPALPSNNPIHSAGPAKDSTTARQLAVQTDRQQDSTTAQQQNSSHTYLQSFLQAKSEQKTTLRYPAALMAEIDDVIYQIKKTYGVTISKNDIFLLGLAYVLFDFKRNADRSLLTAQLIRATH